MINGDLLTLRAGDYVAVVATSGATLVSLTRAGRDLVVPFDATCELPSAYQGKTLVPWPNRITGSAYTYAGTRHEVPCNEAATGAALHGLACWLDWRPVPPPAPATQADGDPAAACVIDLVLDLLPSYGYPFELTVTARYALDAATGLTVTVTAVNTAAPGTATAAAPAPYGVSCHPYLTRGVPVDECTLTLPAARMLQVDEDLAPAGLVDVGAVGRDLRPGAVVGERLIDNAFTALPEGPWEVRLAGGGPGTVVMTASVPWVQVYSGEHLDRRGVAVEPMTCPPDAFNTGVDLITLVPGATHVFTWSLREEH